MTRGLQPLPLPVTVYRRIEPGDKRIIFQSLFSLDFGQGQGGHRLDFLFHVHLDHHADKRKRESPRVADGHGGNLLAQLPRPSHSNFDAIG